jgi:hypothetical protein
MMQVLAAVEELRHQAEEEVAAAAAAASGATDDESQIAQVSANGTWAVGMAPDWGETSCGLQSYHEGATCSIH